MVYIKEMLIKDFKSFKGPHQVPFQTGFTGITGLNGSGKSNIVDAAQFVMGTRSSRVIRAKRLSELVFNGGKKYPPANSCSVTIIFDNKDRELPLDTDEVVFTKRVKINTRAQSGYNVYYYLNKKPSTNGEFERVLAEAGIYVDGYNVVKQGDVTDITRIGPVERRKILDRVERIDTYDKNIEKSREECRQIDESIQRMGFILSEKESSLKTVEKEREAALRYQELGKEKVLLEAKAYKKQMLDVEAKIEHLRQQITKLIKESGDVDVKREKAEEQLRTVEMKLEEIDRKIMEIGGKEAEELKVKIDHIKMKLVALKENNKNDENRILELNGEMKKARENQSGLMKSREKLARESSELSAGLKTIRQVLVDTETRLRNVSEKIGKKDKRSLGIQRDIAQGKKELDELNAKIHELELQLDRLGQRKEHLEGESEELSESYNHMKFQISDAEMALQDLKARVGSQGETKKELDRTLHELRNRLMDYKKDLHDVDVKMRALEREKTRLEAEKHMSQSMAEGRYRRSVQAVLEARDRGVLSGIYGTPLELGKVEEKYETAIQVAVGGDDQAVIVEDDGVGEEAINFLKQYNFGRAKFLPLNMKVLRPKAIASMLMGQPGVIGFAVDLIDFDDKFYPAFSYICRGSVVVKNLSYARNYMGKGVRLVTLDGELIDPMGAMTGGSFGRGKKKMAFGGSSSRDVGEVIQELQKLRAIEQNLNSQIERTVEDIAEIERDLGEYKGKIDVNEIKDLETRRNHYLSRKQALENRIKEKNRELTSVEEEAQELETGLKEDYLRQETLRKSIKENSELLLKSAEKKLATELQTLRESQSATREQERDTLARLDVNRTQRELTEKREEEIDEDIALWQESIETARKDIATRREQIETLEVEEKTLVDMEFKISKELESFRDEKSALIKNESDLHHTIEGMVSKKNTLRELIQDTRFKIPQMEEKYREFEAEYNAIGIIVEGELETLEYLKRKLKDTERKMRNLEPVNMMAIHQFDEIRERIEKIKGEVEEAEHEKSMLLELIDQTIEKKRVRFEKVFNAVNTNFKEIFHELSGGEGEFLLDDPTNPVESGLEIRAAPRGKNPLRIDSLSGGEKSLTAIAFILAIQNYSPAPFYFFDEADMFLDSANSRNIASTIQKYTRHNQFIMITLKEIVLSQADYFYGVSMHEEGGTSEVFTFISKEKALSIAKEAEEVKKKEEQRQLEEQGKQERLVTGGGEGA